MNLGKNIIKPLIIQFVLLSFSILAVRDLLSPGFFESHDGVIHVMRLAHFDRALRVGQFPVRWLPDWMAGYGSPVFNFNWSLPYYVGSLLHGLGFSFESSIKLILIAGVALSAVFMYLFLFELTHEYLPAIVGSILYVWAPYRFTDIFVRGALGEATSFLFFPWLLYLVIKAYRDGQKQFSWWTSVVWAAFISTHNIMSLVGAGIFFAYIWYLKLERQEKIKFLRSAVWNFAVGVLLSAWFWLPAVAEKSFSQISQLGAIYNYREQFITLGEILNSKWQYAYALPSHPDYSMSFQLGFVHLALPFLTIGLILVQLRLRKQKAPLFSQGLFFIWLFLVAVFLSTRSSQFIYDLNLAAVINFPWRFLEIVTLAGAVLAGIAVSLCGKSKLLPSLVLVVLALVLYWPTSRIVSWRLSFSDSEYGKLVKTNINFLPDTEFAPKTAQILPLLEAKGARSDSSFFAGRELEMRDFHEQNLTFTAQLTTPQVTQVSASQFAFPGWQVKVDGKTVTLGVGEFGLINFNLPQGRHLVRVEFTDTPIRKIANVISLIAGTVWILFMTPRFWRFGKRKKL